MVSRDSVVVASKDQVACDLNGEVVLLNFRSGLYFGLDSVGSHVWAEIQEAKAVDTVRDAILRRYAVDPDTCERDLLALLRELATEGLIEVRDEATA
jgi:Coenzyme PQQ synthesis protein D (PqqD)